MLATRPGEYRLDGVPRMRQRPMQELLDALQQLGVDARSEAGNGCPPIRIRSTGLRGGSITLAANRSSQFLSAILLAAPFANSDIDITLTGALSSEPYVEMTLAMLKQWGIAAHRDGCLFHVQAKRSRAPESYAIEPDASAASYFFAAAAIAGGSVTVLGTNREMLQGDIRFIHLLEQMGCIAEPLSDGIRVSRDPRDSLHGINVDMNAISDVVMTLAAVACFADSPTTIRNVAHIRHKETDRIAALLTELRKLGIRADELSDGLCIHPTAMTGCTLETYDDHRMAMSQALIGLRVPGVVISNPGCVAKTYPGFWDDFDRLYSSAS